MNEGTMSNEERGALVALNFRINALASERPNVATRRYTYAEAMPLDVLAPEHVRATIRDELRDLPRARQLEEHATARIKINGVPFLEWEATPDAVRATLPPAIDVAAGGLVRILAEAAA